jgi:hypothetical protein
VAPTYVPGRYKAEVVGQGFERSRLKETPCYCLQLRITGRYDERGDVQDCPRFERTYTQYLANETGVGILRGDLKALGVEVSDLTRLDPGAPDHINLVGRLIEVECGHETFNGQTRERWRIYRPRKKLDLDELAELNARFRQVLGGSPGGASAPTPPDTTSGEDSPSP